MSNSEILRMIEERLESMKEIREDLVKLHEDNPVLFESYTDLTERYNTTWDECKNLLKSVETDDALRIGPFSRDRKKYTTKYKPGLLPDSVLSIPGVVKTVDDSKIVELVTQGIIPQSEVESARYEHSRAPSVRSQLERATLPTIVDVAK